MYQPQEIVQSWVNGWVYGVKKSFEVQEQFSKQAEQAMSIQQEWVKQGMEQQQVILEQWKKQWAENLDCGNSWGLPNAEWIKKGWEEQEKALNQSWNQFQTILKQAKEQQDKGKEKVVSMVEETGEKIKQWAQFGSSQA